MILLAPSPERVRIIDEGEHGEIIVKGWMRGRWHRLCAVESVQVAREFCASRGYQTPIMETRKEAKP